MRLTALAVALAAAVIPAAAQAGETGFYGSINVSGVSTSDVDSVIYAPDGAIFGYIYDAKVIKAAAPAPAGSDIIEGSWDVKSSLGVSGAVGYDFGMFRAEAELAYSRGTVRTFNVTQLTGYSGSTTTDFGDGSYDACDYLGLTACDYTGNAVNMEGLKLRQLSGMANLWVDIPLEAPVEPYVGGGIGVTGLEVNGEGKTAFAWQVGAGLAYKISDTVAITADYRHREADGVQFNYGGGEGANFGKVKTNSYGMGLRVNF